MARTKAVNVVLVHGGFVDGSGWRGVYEFLKKEGYEVSVVQNPTTHRGGIMNRGAFVGRTRLFGVLLLGALLGACGGGGGSTANDRQGPTLACTAPVDGATLNQPPGQITLNGSVSDPDGVSSLSVNGAPIAVAASGNFSAPLSTTWGINLVTLSATDGLGNQGRGTCAFLVADTWAPDNTFLDGAISFNVAQPALDDGNRSSAIDSLADVLHAGLNSSGLNSAFTNFLLATNPLIDQCVVPGLFGTCTVYVRIRALSAAVGVPVSTSLQLIQSGLSVSVSAPNITIQFLVDGSVFGVPYSVPGTATFGNASVVAQLSGEVSNGQPVTHVNSISPNLGTVSITFGGSGVVSDVLNAVSSVFSALAPTLEQYFGSIVISWILPLLSNVSIIPALASTFDVTRLDGTGSISVSFGTNYSTLDFSASRMLAVLGTQFTVTPASAAQTMGAPIPDGVRPLDLGAAAPVGIAFHIGLLDQALYSLWRAGYYDDNFGGGGLGGVVGAGAGFEMTTALPPAAQLLGNGRVEIALGAVSGRLMDPTIAPTEVPLQLGARVSCVPSLAGDRLVLDGCTVDQLAWSNAGPALGAQAQSKVEQFITSLVTALATLGAEDALPVLPIPAVPLDSLLALVGLPPANPAGQILGIVSPTLSKLGDHVVLEGAFGSR